jgi:hypothetical protein
MSTYTPPTTLLVAYVATQLAALTIAGGYRTDIGLAVTTEREQVLDTAGASCNLTVSSWEATEGTVAIERLVDLQIEVSIPATVSNAEAQAQLAIEDVFERFRVPGASVTLAGNVFALLQPVSAAEINRPEGAASVVGTLTLRAQLIETV